MRKRVSDRKHICDGNIDGFLDYKKKDCSNFEVEELNTWGNGFSPTLQDELQQALPDTGFFKSTLEWLETWITQMNINKKQSSSVPLCKARSNPTCSLLESFFHRILSWTSRASIGNVRASHRKEDTRMSTLVMDMTCQSINAVELLCNNFFWQMVE